MTNAQYFWMRHNQVVNAYVANNLHYQASIAGASEAADEKEKEKDEQDVPSIPVSSQDELRAAFSDAKDGDVLKMQSSIELNGGQESVLVSKNISLDLNNQTVSATGLAGNTSDTVFAITRGGTLTIDGNGLIDGSEDSHIYAAIKLTVKGEDADGEPANLVINDGNYKGTYYAVTGHGSRQNTNVTINGGHFEGTTINDSVAIFQPQSGVLTINGGEFIGASAIYQKSGKIIINGGTFAANGVAAPFVHSGNGWNNTGDCIVVEACDYPGHLPEIEVLGGTFISENGKPIASYAQNSNFERITKFVKGGKFNKKLDDDLVADGYTQIESDGFWKVIKA